MAAEGIYMCTCELYGKLHLEKSSMADGPTLLVQHLLLRPTGNFTYMFNQMSASI